MMKFPIRFVTRLFSPSLAPSPRAFGRALIASIAAAVLAPDVRVLAAAPIAGYSDDQTMSSQIASLGESPVVSVRSLTKTLGGRDVYLMTIGTGEVDGKPAILVMGNVHAPHLAGSELAVQVARRIASDAASDEKTKKLLDRFTFYVIARPNPDASEAFFQTPSEEREGNARETDDDRDGARGEDPNEDLNGDGVITMMRIADPSGDFIVHPDDPRVMIRVDRRKKNESGAYRLVPEGRDNDEDGLQGEDGPGGVSLNRNFTFNYPYFQPGAGPHQVSEKESRAVADFAFAHPNIAAVFTFTPQDNLMHPWKPNATAERGRIKTTLLSADAPYTDFMAQTYRTIHGGKEAPPSAASAGAFGQWAYFHYGRWSLSARAWWIPKTSPPKPAEGEKPPESAKPSGEKRGADDVNALAWMKQQNIDGFVDWKPIDHPDYPGKKVEIGGFRPFVRLNPPAAELPKLAEKHAAFLAELCTLMPRVSIEPPKVEPLGEGVFRLTVTVRNDGYLPTMSEMGRISRHVHPLQLEMKLPEGTKLITGSRRVALPRLSGNGATHETTWLIRTTGNDAATLSLRVSSPSVGSHERSAELK